PVRPREHIPAPFPIASVVNPADTPPYDPLVPGADGRIVQRRETPPSSYPVAGVGTVLTSGGELLCEMVAGDPLSCRWRQTSSSAWKRGDWDCAVEASYDLTADASAFHLVETLRA